MFREDWSHRLSCLHATSLQIYAGLSFLIMINIIPGTKFMMNTAKRKTNWKDAKRVLKVLLKLEQILEEINNDFNLNGLLKQ